MFAEKSEGNQPANALARQPRIIRIKEVVFKTGLCKREIYTRISEGRFPSPVAIGPRARGFVEHEIDGWISHTIASGRNQEQA